MFAETEFFFVLRSEGLYHLFSSFSQFQSLRYKREKRTHSWEAT